MTITNETVIELARQFVQGMRKITDYSDIGSDICKHPEVGSIVELCAECAKGNAAESPVSLTIACAPQATFNIEGTHAYGTLTGEKRHGVWLMATLIAAILMVAFVLYRR